jgi:hypothetical protein
MIDEATKFTSFTNTLATPGRFSPYSLPVTVIGPKRLRNSAIPPLHASSYAGSDGLFKEFLNGAQALGANNQYRSLKGQQGVIADVCNATGEDGLPLFETIGICIPRRATKTSSVFAVAIGRLLNRPGYRVGLTAQTGAKARTRWLDDIVDPLLTAYPDNGSRPFIINRSQGGEKITFANGSRLVVLPPKEDAARGESFNLFIIDEAQEFDAEEAQKLKAGIEPAFDTKPDHQLIVLGTAGEFRGGLLWDTLELGRRGEAGIVEYAVPDTLSPEDFMDEDGEKDWDKAEAHVLAAHPGIGQDDLTPLKVVRTRFLEWPLAAWLREYAGLWPRGIGSSILNMDKWMDGKRDDAPPVQWLPKDAVLGISVHPNQSVSALVAAWREDGKAVLLLVDHRPGIEWLTDRVTATARKYKLPISHDTTGAVGTEVDVLKKTTPRLKLRPQKWADIKVGHAQLTKDVDTGKVSHWDQDGLRNAVNIVTKRQYGERGGWAFGRKHDGDDITPIEAAALALMGYDAQPKKRATTIYTGPE